MIFCRIAVAGLIALTAVGTDGPVRAQSDTPNTDFLQAEVGRGRPQTAKAYLEKLERQMARTITRPNDVTGEDIEIEFFTHFGRKRSMNCNTLLANHGDFGLERVKKLDEYWTSRMNRCTWEDWWHVDRTMDHNRQRTEYLRCKMLEQRRLSITEFLLYEIGRGTALDIVNPLPDSLGDIGKEGAAKGAGRISKAAGATAGAFVMIVEGAVLGKLAYDARGRLELARTHERQSRMWKKLWKKSWDETIEWEESFDRRVASSTLPNCPPVSGPGSDDKADKKTPEDPAPPEVTEKDRKKFGKPQPDPKKRKKTVGGIPVPERSTVLEAIQALPWVFQPPGLGAGPLDRRCFAGSQEELDDLLYQTNNLPLKSSCSTIELINPADFNIPADFEGTNFGLFAVPGLSGDIHVVYRAYPGEGDWEELLQDDLELESWGIYKGTTVGVAQDNKKAEFCAPMGQRVGLARALCTPCTILLLDEPTSGLTFDQGSLNACLGGQARTEVVSADPDKETTLTGMKVYLEGGVFSNIPLSQPTIGSTQNIDKSVGWGADVSIYTPVWHDTTNEIQVGLSGFGTWNNNARLINQAPFPSSAFGGQTDILGLMLMLAWERRLTNELSLRTMAGFGAANVDFTGAQNGVTVVRGQELVPAFQVGLGTYYDITNDLDLGFNVSYLWTGSLDTRTNTGVPLRLDGTRDLMVGISLRLELDSRE